MAQDASVMRRGKALGVCLKRIVLGGLVALAVLAPAPLRASEESRALVPQSHCGLLLEFVGRLQELTSGILTVSTDDSPEPAGWALLQHPAVPEWVRQLAVFHRTVQPHLPYIQLVNSPLLSQIIAIQLRELGVRSQPQAHQFVARFSTLPMSEQLSFVNSLVFRLLWESAASLSTKNTVSRPGVDHEALKLLHPVLTSPAGRAQFQNLTLFLMGHLELRSQAYADAVDVQWNASGLYVPPPAPAGAPRALLHGLWTDPRTGERLYDGDAIAAMLARLQTLGAEPAMAFFLDKHLPELSFEEIHKLSQIAGLPPAIQAQIDEWEHPDAEHSSTPSARFRRQLVQSARAELTVVEARLRMLDSTERLVGLGNTEWLLEILQTELRTCVSSLGSQTCGVLQSTVQFLLEGLGYVTNPQALRAVGWLTGSVLGLFSDTATNRVSVLFDELRDRAFPLAAIASEIGNTDGLKLRRETLVDRQAALQAKLLRLEGPTTTP